MSSTTFDASTSDERRVVTPASTRTLLTAGVIAGPLFLTAAAAQVVTRGGFDLGQHPISLLALGDLGWIQIGNFVITGLLVIAFAVGVGRVLRDGRGSRWIPRFLAGFGLGLIVAGAFVADPENAFPAGTPDGAASAITWHGILHGVGAGLAFDSLIVACILLALRLKKARQRIGALASAAVALALLVVPAPVSTDGLSIRLAVAALIAFATTSVLAAWLLRQTADQSRQAR